jgi:hypothetical protein
LPKNSYSSSLEQYIASTIDAARRTRRVLVLVVTAIILSSAGLWNSRQDNWPSARLGRLRAMYLMWDSTAPPNNSNEQEIREALQFARQYGSLTSREDLLSRIHTLEAARIDQLKVRIPFFGVEFDINDLGVLTGMTFVALLGWLRFALSQESINLELTFEKARSLDTAKERDLLRDCYQRLHMGGVLAMPMLLPMDGNPEDQNSPFWHRALNKICGVAAVNLFVVGLMIQMLVWVSDLSMFKIGWALNRSGYTDALVVETILLILSIFMALGCTLFIRKLSRTWKMAADELSATSG